MRTYRCLTIAGPLLILLAACPHEPSIQLPRDLRDDSDPQRVFQTLRRDAGRNRGVVGRMTARGRLSGQRIRATVDFLMAFPDRLYLEVGHGGAGPLAVVSCNGTDLTLILPRRGEFVREEASAAMLDRLIGIPLSPEEIVPLLAGDGIPLSLYSPSGAARLSSGGRELILDAASGALNRRATLTVGCVEEDSSGSRAGPSCLRILKGRLQSAVPSEPALEFAYRRFSHAGGRLDSVRVRGRGGLRLTIRFQDTAVREEAVEPSLFDIPVRRGMRRLRPDQFRSGGPVLIQALRGGEVR